MSAAGLGARVRVVRGAFVLDTDLTVAPGEVLGVIGANGSGKSTLLGALAGTLDLESGVIELSGRTLSERGPDRPGVSVPRAARRIGHLDQRARMFPHLNARANIAFGPRAQGGSRRDAEAVAAEWLERVGLGARGEARHDELSGGQQQRVAIARTLAADPSLLLLDEPFAALDVTSSDGLRHLLRTEIRRLGVPAVLVTHDPIDLIGLADRVLVIESGRVGQRGPVPEVLAAPATRFAAEFAGRALLAGRASDRSTLVVDGAPIRELPVDGSLPPAGAPAVASFDPRDVALTPLSAEGRPGREERLEPPGAIRWTGTVASISASRNGVRVVCEEWPDFCAELPIGRAVELGLTAGARVELALPPQSLRSAAPPADL